jgi:hypothetical protein
MKGELNRQDAKTRRNAFFATDGNQMHTDKDKIAIAPGHYLCASDLYLWLKLFIAFSLAS